MSILTQEKKLKESFVSFKEILDCQQPLTWTELSLICFERPGEGELGQALRGRVVDRVDEK